MELPSNVKFTIETRDGDGNYQPIDPKEFKKLKTREGIAFKEMGINISAIEGGIVTIMVKNLEKAKGAHLEVEKVGLKTEIVRNTIGETILERENYPYTIHPNSKFLFSKDEYRVASITIQDREDKVPQQQLRITLSEPQKPSGIPIN